MSRSAARAALLFATGATFSACTSAPRPARQIQPAPPPELAITPMVEQLAAMPMAVPGSTELPGADRRVSFVATDADLRRLIHLLAEAAGLSAVIGPEIQGKVSVDFSNVTAREALKLLLAQAGIGDLSSGLRSPWPPVVFYPLPANIRYMSVEAIQAHFRVSREIAETVARLRY